MGFLTLSMVLMRFIKNLQTDELDGAKWGSAGGLVMPSFFFQGAQDIFNNVRAGAAEAQKRFQETGRYWAHWSVFWCFLLKYPRQLL